MPTLPISFLSSGKKQPISAPPEFSRANQIERIPHFLADSAACTLSKNLTKTDPAKPLFISPFARLLLSISLSTTLAFLPGSTTDRFPPISLQPLNFKMASRIGPRSVKDATRFTSTIPHATSKSATSAATPSAASRIPGETPEQRVRRLRQAHLAAQRAQVSKTDKVIDASRRFFDVAHRWTVGGLVMFTGTWASWRGRGNELEQEQ